MSRRRDLFARAALQNIPKILTLQDRNPHSPTYGCFDRNYWLYRIIDFPSGMAQEFCWPLALAHEADLPDNPFHRQPEIREWAVAGVRYAARSAHPDGSCDDYFPYEKAGGAAAFSLLACVSTCRLLELNDEEIVSFLERRADWLASHQESGRLTNHHALILLGLHELGEWLGTDRWAEAAERRLEQVLAWQHAEGWFQEYEGCDPGYLTLTISCLAAYHAKRPDERVEEALRRAVDVAGLFIHPDGTFGGEYGSRNTLNFFPHGFELVGRWMPEALAINDRFLDGLHRGLQPCYADDHIIGHHAWNYLLAWRDFVPERGPAEAPADERRYLEGAEILVERRGDARLYVALNKGGAFKLFRGGRLVASDTHLSLRVAGRNAVGHLIDRYDCSVDADRISVAGSLGWAKHKLMNPLAMVISRIAMLTIGRFCADLIRRLLQRLLVTGKRAAPFRFQRVFEWEGNRLAVTDRLEADSWEGVESCGIGGHQTSICVVMSRTFQPAQLQPWCELTEDIRRLAPGEAFAMRREL
ncbi:MAG TPA: hypothetical protein PLU30_19460 [Verrucomicrobiae bacterium]|nr:hypothetical protein [Verrucomicrobiae bacterium]